MRVLLVEDEPGIAKFISQGLSEAGYAVDVAKDGIEGLHYANVAEYDVLTQTVLEAYPDATIEETELVRENGVLVYEVELDNEPDVLVDANSGEIIGTDDDEEEDE